MDRGFWLDQNQGGMMVMFSKVPVVALAAMFVAMSASCAAGDVVQTNIDSSNVTLANAADLPTYNALLAQKAYPKITIKSQLSEAALKLLLIEALFTIIAWHQLNYSRILCGNFWGLAFFGSGLVAGKKIGMEKIYRQLTRKFGFSWKNWGLKNAKLATVSVKNDAGA
jgi:hypothetical protein